MDWNNDGYDDILVGDYGGYINYFQRNSNGTLQAGVRLKSEGRTIDVGLHSSPDFVDWDNDGDLDMITGKKTERLWVFINTGTASSYRFDGHFDFVAGGSILEYPRAYPSIYDMNNDGLFDIVMGRYYPSKNFHYFENTGTLGRPSFAANSLLKLSNGNPVVNGATLARVEVADWNDDGAPDLIAGGGFSNCEVFHYQAIPPSSTEESSAGFVVPATISMLENPVRSDLSVSINLGATSIPSFTVYTIDGRIAMTHTATMTQPGYNTVTIPNNLTNGTYILHCTAGNRELAERFVVAK